MTPADTTDIAAPADTSEAAWLANTYQRDQPQLTARAIVVGILIGGVMSLSNIYVFFKTGWSLGVTLTACILAFGTFQGLQKIGLVKTPLTALENNALSTVAAGAGYMTAGGNMAAFGALLMVTTVRPSGWSLVIWFAVISALGVFAAIPIKRQLINKEQLAFPTGTATAETIRSMHATSDAAVDGNAPSRGSPGRSLAIAGAFGALVALLRDAKWTWMPVRLPDAIPLPFKLAGRDLAEWTIKLKVEVVLLSAGALMSFRTAWSILLGGVLTYAVLAPAMVEQGVINEITYKAIVGFTLWPGAAMLVTSGVTAFAFDYKSIWRSLSGLTSLFRKDVVQTRDPMDDIEVPAQWFPLGFMVLAPIIVVLMVVMFQIPWWAGVIAVPLAVLLGFVAARVTGETDVTPTKALGPVTQLIFGVLTPGNLSGNIMSANVTGGIGLHAADLLTTLKTGWLLGANPRAQFFAQLFGIVAGAAIIVPAFFLVMPDPSVLGSSEWPAPSCVVWAGVSKAFANGIGALPSAAQTGVLVGGLLGIALALVEKFAPPRIKSMVPSPAGVGIAMVMPAASAIAMFLGGTIAEVLRRRKPKVAERYVVPVASGLIAGESLMGIVIALLVVAGWMPR